MGAWCLCKQEDNGEGIKFTRENYELSDVTEAICYAVQYTQENTDDFGL